MPKGLTDKTKQLIEAAHNILEEQHPMTIRQLFYQLVIRHIIENCQKSYKRVSKVMTGARERGEIDPDFVVDRSKPEQRPNVWTDTTAYLEAVMRGYRLDYWADQPYYCELWLEKETLTGSVEDTTYELGIWLRTHRGYSSTTKKIELANLFDRVNKPIKIFYVGDWDPSGLDIVRDLVQKISRYQKTTNYPKLIRVGIHREDITAYNLPPCRIKEKDPRSEEFEKKYGPDTVESDALPPAELRQRIKDAVQELIDVPLWNRKLKVEEAEFRSIKEFAERFKSSQVSI